jgi:hypothetical protein
LIQITKIQVWYHFWKVFECKKWKNTNLNFWDKIQVGWPVIDDFFSNFQSWKKAFASSSIFFIFCRNELWYIYKIDFYVFKNAFFLVFSKYFFLKWPLFCKKKNIKIHISFDPIYVYVQVLYHFGKVFEWKKWKKYKFKFLGQNSNMVTSHRWFFFKFSKWKKKYDPYLRFFFLLSKNKLWHNKESIFMF